MINKSDKLLAIDTTIGSGSVSSLISGEESAHSVGTGSDQLSSNLIEIIERICDEASVDKKELDTLAVSLGPGSYTGIRVGISTVLGLGRAIGCRKMGVGTLTAMASIAGDECIAALAAGRNRLIIQRFGPNLVPTSPAETIEASKFKEAGRVITDTKGGELILRGREKISDATVIELVPENFATVVGELAVTNPRIFSADLLPIYGTDFNFGVSTRG